MFRPGDSTKVAATADIVKGFITAVDDITLFELDGSKYIAAANNFQPAQVGGFASLAAAIQFVDGAGGFATLGDLTGTRTSFQWNNVLNEGYVLIDHDHDNKVDELVILTGVDNANDFVIGDFA